VFDARYDYRYVLYTEMKEETKNEMDLLLRRLGRRDDATVPDADHLDADELSAYAENALPSAARARYTGHLAECSRCRQLVVQLGSSVGVVAASETAKVARPSGWKSFLASLFTPMVLRYAAPALGLIVVAAIGFVVLRREQSAKFVTQVTNNEQRPVALPQAEPGATVLNDEAAKSEPRLEGLVEKQKNQNSAGPAPPPNAAPVVSSVESDVSKDKAAQPKPEEQTTAANEAPPPPKATPSTTVEESPKPADTEVSKKEVRDFRATAPTAQRGLRAAEREERKTDNFVRDPKATDEIGVAGAGSVAKLKRDELSANTRSVAGRRFQKKGGVWIDTAYDSSKDIVSLTRGSEQYRALVADEPAIKTIADELEGEIIVVWKRQTYRIR
jgi:hypothetical protein